MVKMLFLMGTINLKFDMDLDLKVKEFSNSFFRKYDTISYKHEELIYHFPSHANQHSGKHKNLVIQITVFFFEKKITHSLVACSE